MIQTKKKSSKRTKEQVQTKNKNRNKTLQSDRPADFHPELPSKETNIYQKHPKTIIQIAFIRQKNHPNSFVMLCGDPKKRPKHQSSTMHQSNPIRTSGPLRTPSTIPRGPTTWLFRPGTSKAAGESWSNVVAHW